MTVLACLKTVKMVLSGMIIPICAYHVLMTTASLAMEQTCALSASTLKFMKLLITCAVNGALALIQYSSTTK